MDSLKKYGFDLNLISLSIGVVVATLSYYIIYNYLLMSENDKNKKDDIYIMVYSIVPSIILAILTIFLYSKYTNGSLTSFGSNNNDLLQEDFYG